MKIDIITTELKDMVARAIKGASCNKILPLTNYMGFEVVDNTLYLKTTDGLHYLTVCKDKVKCEDFACVLPVQTFAKLVNNAPPASPALLLVKLQFIILRLVLRVYIPPPLFFAELLIKLQLIKFMKLPGEVLSK